MATLINVEIRWTSVEYYSSDREVDLDEVMSWVNESLPVGQMYESAEQVTDEDIQRFFEAGEPADDLELEAMSEGTNWHDRDDAKITDVQRRGR